MIVIHHRGTEINRGSQRNQMSFTFINPESLGAPHGYTNGVLTEAGGRWLFIAGQIGWDENQKIVSDDLVEQFDRALANIITIAMEAGGKADHIPRLIIYLVDEDQYRRRL